MKNKTIALIGAGNVATHLARQLTNVGYTIVQVYSRSVASASELANRLKVNYTTNLEEITDKANFYIFSIKDSALEEVISNMPHSNGIWIHTSGSMPMNIFKGKVQNYGVLYPLQTFSKTRVIEWKNIPIFIEASDDATYQSINQLAGNISSRVSLLSSEDRKQVHLSAVFACNFVNHMYNIANTIVGKANLSFDILLPLIKETCEKVYTLSPHNAQTGPAVRYDENVISKHIDLLDTPELKKIYQLLSESIHKNHQ